MKIADSLNFLIEGKLPQEKAKRTEVRKKGAQNTSVDKNSHGLNSSNVVGWFSNKYNAWGWSLHKLTPDEAKEFGSSMVFRSLSDSGNTSIIKFNLAKGTYAFLDNEAYEEGDIKFEKASPYTKVVVDTDKQDEFNLV